MKQLLPFMFLALFLFSCEKEDETRHFDNIELGSFIVDNYFEDARQLYFHEIFNNTAHFNYDNPILDENEVTKILKIIQAVYNSRSPERDSVFDFYKIHGYYCYSFNSISLRVDTALVAIKNLAKGIFPVGEPALDNLLSSYNFDSVKTSFSYPLFPWLTIYTDHAYNMIPIEKEFSDIESILIAEFNKGCLGDGNSIDLIRNDDSATITFSYGSGDCPAGCMHHKYWEFKVANGKAKFVRTY